MPVLPKRIPHGPRPPASAAHVSPLHLEAAGKEADAVFQKPSTAKGGLPEPERRSREHGPNVVARHERHPAFGCPARPSSTRS